MGVAAEAADAACRGEFAASARLEHVPITLTDAGRQAGAQDHRAGYRVRSGTPLPLCSCRGLRTSSTSMSWRIWNCANAGPDTRNTSHAWEQAPSKDWPQDSYLDR
jgi:hypothetical protein